MWWLEHFWSCSWCFFWWIGVYRQAGLGPCSGVSSGPPHYYAPVRYRHCYWDYIILLHLITDSKKLGATFLFMPKCHPCPLWVDYPFTIRHAAAGTDTALFKHVYLVFSSFSTLHIYFVPCHCSNRQSWSFHCTKSQELLHQDDLLKDPLPNFLTTWVWECGIL